MPENNPVHAHLLALEAKMARSPSAAYVEKALGQMAIELDEIADFIGRDEELMERARAGDSRAVLELRGRKVMFECQIYWIDKFFEEQKKT